MDARGRRPLALIGLLILLLLAVATTHAFHHHTGTCPLPSFQAHPSPPLHVFTTAPPHNIGPSVVSSRRRSAFQPSSRSMLSPSSLSFAPWLPRHQCQYDHLEGRRWQLLPLAAAGGKGFGKKSSKEGEGESSKQQAMQRGASKVRRELQMNEKGSATSHF